MTEHPFNISDRYRGQVRRPGDERDQEERDAGRAALEGQPRAVEHEGMAEFAAAWEQYAEEIGAVETTTTQENPVNAAIMQAVEQAGQRVEAAALTAEQRMAKAIAAELRDQVITDDAGEETIYLDEPEATDEETAQLSAWLDSGDDVPEQDHEGNPAVGTDAAGNVIYEDAETGERYVLEDALMFVRRKTHEAALACVAELQEESAGLQAACRGT